MLICLMTDIAVFSGRDNHKMLPCAFVSMHASVTRKSRLSEDVLLTILQGSCTSGVVKMFFSAHLHFVMSPTFQL